MTLDQLNSLTDEELGMALYIVNVLKPIETNPNLSPRLLTAIKHPALVQKIVESFDLVKPEAHEVYSSLLKKLGVEFKIEKKEDKENDKSELQTEQSGSVVP